MTPQAAIQPPDSPTDDQDNVRYVCGNNEYDAARRVVASKRRQSKEPEMSPKSMTMAAECAQGAVAVDLG